jgi:hypothetical protein
MFLSVFNLYFIDYTLQLCQYDPGMYILTVWGVLILVHSVKKVHACCPFISIVPICDTYPLPISVSYMSPLYVVHMRRLYMLSIPVALICCPSWLSIPYHLYMLAISIRCPYKPSILIV